MRKSGLFLYRDACDGYRWRVIGRNGKIVAASSETFTRPSAAKANILLVRKAMAQPFTDLTKKK